MEPPELYAPIKLPLAFDGLVIKIYNSAGLGILRVRQKKAVFVDGKWIVEIYLTKDDDHLTLRDGA